MDFNIFAPQFIGTIDHPHLPQQDVMNRLRSLPNDKKTKFHALRLPEDTIHLSSTFEATQKGAEGEERLPFCTIYVPPMMGKMSESGYLVQYVNPKGAEKVKYVDIVNLDRLDICTRLHHENIKSFPPIMILTSADNALNNMLGVENPGQCSLM